MKYIIAVLFAVVLLIPSKQAQAQFTLGGGIQVLDGAGIGVNFYRNTDNLYKNTRTGGDIGYYVYDGGSVLEVSINGQWFFLDKSALKAYALGGTTVLFYKTDTVIGNTASILNLGAGAEYHIGFGSAYGEARFLVGGTSLMGLNAGVRITL